MRYASTELHTVRLIRRNEFPQQVTMVDCSFMDSTRSTFAFFLLINKVRLKILYAVDIVRVTVHASYGSRVLWSANFL